MALESANTREENDEKGSCLYAFGTNSLSFSSHFLTSPFLSILPFPLCLPFPESSSSRNERKYKWSHQFLRRKSFPFGKSSYSFEPFCVCINEGWREKKRISEWFRWERTRCRRSGRKNRELVVIDFWIIFFVSFLLLKNQTYSPFSPPNSFFETVSLLNSVFYFSPLKLFRSACETIWFSFLATDSSDWMNHTKRGKEDRNRDGGVKDAEYTLKLNELHSTSLFLMFDIGSRRRIGTTSLPQDEEKCDLFKGRKNSNWNCNLIGFLPSPSSSLTYPFTYNLIKRGPPSEIFAHIWSREGKGRECWRGKNFLGVAAILGSRFGKHLARWRRRVEGLKYKFKGDGYKSGRMEVEMVQHEMKRQRESLEKKVLIQNDTFFVFSIFFSISTFKSSPQISFSSSFLGQPLIKMAKPWKRSAGKDASEFCHTLDQVMHGNETESFPACVIPGAATFAPIDFQPPKISIAKTRISWAKSEMQSNENTFHFGTNFSPSILCKTQKLLPFQLTSASFGKEHFIDLVGKKKKKCYTYRYTNSGSSGWREGSSSPHFSYWERKKETDLKGRSWRIETGFHSFQSDLNSFRLREKFKNRSFFWLKNVTWKRYSVSEMIF